MAKLGSKPSRHKRRAERLMREGVRSLREAERALKRGKCSDAYEAYVHGSNLVSEAQTHAREVGKNFALDLTSDAIGSKKVTLKNRIRRGCIREG